MSTIFIICQNSNQDIKFNDVQNWLKRQNVYTLHRDARKHFTRNRYYVSHIKEQYEADIVDMHEFSRENDGYKFLLVVIDVFSKKGFVVPLKNKSAIEVIRGFKIILRDGKPMKLRTDRGKEFVNAMFRRYCQLNNINFFTTQNRDIKCAVVERFNRTLKAKMNKYFTSVGNRRYIEYLPQLVNSYNNRIHSTTKMAPNAMGEEDEPEVFENIHRAKIY